MVMKSYILFAAACAVLLALLFLAGCGVTYEGKCQVKTGFYCINPY